MGLVKPPAVDVIPEVNQGSLSQIQASHAPRLVSAREMRKNKQECTQKIAIIGHPGSGTTYSVFSLVKYLGTVKQLKPEQIRIEVIDLDGGMNELVDQQIIPDEYLDCLQIAVCHNFTEVVDATKEAYERLREHKKKYGLVGSWIAVDNMEKAWSYPQEDFCQAVYGMSLTERLKQASRKSQAEPKKPGQKGESVFNQTLDWSLVKPMYSDWAKSFESCGFNFLWLSSWKPDEITDLDGNVKEIREKFGNGDNNPKVSHIVKKYQIGNGTRRADFIKSRSTQGLPKNLTDTSWAGIFNELEKLETYERKEREAQLKRESFGGKPPEHLPVMDEDKKEQCASEISVPTMTEAEKEQRVNEIMAKAVEHSVQATEAARAEVVAPKNEVIDW